MIVKSTFRDAGGLVAHLERSDTNEAVHVRTDLFRGAAPDLSEALRFMDGLAHAAGVKRVFLHVVVSPSKELDEEQIARVLEVVEQEYGVPQTTARAVVQHEKGARPSHLHIVYATVDAVSGRSIRSHNSYEKNELIGRSLELQLGHSIVQGPRMREVANALRERGQENDATALDQLAGVRNRDELSTQDRRQAERTGADPRQLSHLVFRLFEQTGGVINEGFRAALSKGGFTLCRGEQAILLQHDATGFQTSLVRLLRREAKAAGQKTELREQHLAAALPDLAPRDADEDKGLAGAARDEGLERARRSAVESVATAWNRATYEAAADGDLKALADFRARRRKEREDAEKLAREQSLQTLKARRAEIDALYKKEEEIRWQRVERAFRIARLFGHPSLRRLAFTLAGAGALMTGAGLVAALAAAGIASAAMPSIQAAARRAARAKAETKVARGERARRKQAAFDELRGGGSLPRKTRFTFESIPQHHRALAGFYAAVRLGGDAGSDSMIERAGKALGAEVTASIAAVLERGSALQVSRILRWYRAVPTAQRQKVVEATLRAHEQSTAAAPRRSKAGRGRGRASSGSSRER